MSFTNNHTLTVFPLDLEGSVAGDEALVFHGLQEKVEYKMKE